MSQGKRASSYLHEIKARQQRHAVFHHPLFKPFSRRHDRLSFTETPNNLLC